MASLEFTHLPLVEVVVRLALQQELPTDLARLARVHRAIEGKFPRFGEAGRMEQAPGRPLVIGSPSVAFAGNDNGLVLTLQPDLLAVGWRAQGAPTLAEGARNYPRYAALRSALAEFVEAVASAFDDSELAVTAANMTYTNFIELQDRALPEIFERYFVPESRPPFTSGGVLKLLSTSWTEGAQDLAYTMNHASGGAPDKVVNGLLLTTTVGEPLTLGAAAAFARIDAVHERLQMLFVALTTDLAREDWGYVAD